MGLAREEVVPVPGKAAAPMFGQSSLGYDRRQAVDVYFDIADAALATAPAVADGVVYVGSGNNNVYALDAATGAQAWSFPTGAPVTFSSPAVADGVVYVGSNDGKVYSFTLAGGVAPP